MKTVKTETVLKNVMGEKFNDGVAYVCERCGNSGVMERTPLTLGMAIFNSLAFNDDKNLSEEEAYKRHLLTQKIADGTQVTLDAKEISTILGCAHKRYTLNGALGIYGALRTILDPEEEPKKKTSRKKK